MTIGEIIYNQRRKLGYTLEDVGKAVGVTKGTVLRWENGAIHNMKRDKIESLARFLQLDPSIFIIPSEVLTADEQHLIELYRNADDRAKRDAIRTLEEHQIKDTNQKAI